MVSICISEFGSVSIFSEGGGPALLEEINTSWTQQRQEPTKHSTACKVS